jgi:hypothetical protein
MKYYNDFNFNIHILQNFYIFKNVYISAKEGNRGKAASILKEMLRIH